MLFMAGLPRTGSTLLLNILAQDPLLAPTPTSGLVDLVHTIRTNWVSNQWFKAEGLEIVKPRITSAIAGMIRGYHKDVLQAGRIPIDKNRGWLTLIEVVEEVLQRPIKIIVTTRDIRSIVASFERLYRAHPLTRPPGSKPSLEGRVQDLMTEQLVIGEPIAFTRDAIRRGLADRLLMVPYEQLVGRPQVVVPAIRQALGLPEYDHDYLNVAQVTHEDDSAYGYPLHTIRPRVTAERSSTPWDDVLPPTIADALVAEYPDVQRWAGINPEG